MTDPVLVSCDCGANERFESEREFDATPGTMFMVENALASLCPDCGAIRRLVEDGITITATGSKTNLDSDETPPSGDNLTIEGLANIAQGGGTISQKFRRTDIFIKSETVKSLTSKSPFANEVNARLGLDPDRLGFCPSCDEQILPDHVRSDGDEPELGWEYYICPDCGHKGTEEAIHDE